MRIPGVMLREQVVIEPYAGQAGAGGPTFGAAVTVRAHVEPKHRRVQSADGEESVSTAVAYMRPDTEVPVGSRVTWDGHVLVVLSQGSLWGSYRELDLGGAGQAGGG